MSRILCTTRSVTFGESIRLLGIGSLILILGFVQPSYAQPTPLGITNGQTIHNLLPYLLSPDASTNMSGNNGEAEKPSFESLIIKKLTEAQKILVTKCDID